MKQILLFFLNDLHLGFSFETIAKVSYITSGENWQKEIEELKDKLGNVSSTLTDSAQKLKEDYLQKLTVLEDQVNFGLDFQCAFSTNFAWSWTKICLSRLRI